MKIFFKKNKILFVGLILIVIWVIITAIMYLYDFNALKQSTLGILEKCKGDNSSICNFIKVPVIPDTMSVFFQLMLDYPLRIFIFYVSPLFIVLSSISTHYNDIKGGYIKNALIRTSYRNYMRRVYLSSLKNTLILPFFLFILFITSFLISGYFGIPTEDSGILAQAYLNQLPLFMVIYVLNIFLLNFMMVNISFIAIVKCNHKISAMISAYMGYWVIEIVLEAIIGIGLETIFNIEFLTNSLALFNFWVYDHVISLPFMICFALSLVLISLFVVYLVCRNKEKVVLNGEKAI